LPTVDRLMADVVAEYQAREDEARRLLYAMVRELTADHPPIDYAQWIQATQSWLTVGEQSPCRPK
jgi:hypothetical protein